MQDLLEKIKNLEIENQLLKEVKDLNTEGLECGLKEIAQELADLREALSFNCHNPENKGTLAESACSCCQSRFNRLFGKINND